MLFLAVDAELLRLHRTYGTMEDTTAFCCRFIVPTGQSERTSRLLNRIPSVEVDDTRDIDSSSVADHINKTLGVGSLKVREVPAHRSTSFTIGGGDDRKWEEIVNIRWRG